MNALHENSKGLGGGYQPQSGMQRLIPRWAFRHLRLVGATQLAGGGVAAAVGAACLWYGADGWAVFFLVVAVLDLASGAWFLALARSRNRREALRPRS